MRVEVEIEVADLDNPDARDGVTEGVIATCNRCDHQTESFGTSERSVKRCLALLREECPQNEENFYVDLEE